MTIAVIRQLGGIGDVLMASPVVRGLREKHPEATIRYVTSSAYMGGVLMELARHNPLIDEIEDVPAYGHTTLRTIENQPALSEDAVPLELSSHACIRDVDLVVDLNNACWDGEAVEITMAGKVLTHRTDLFCRHAGVEPSSKRPIYVVDPAERDFAAMLARSMGWFRRDDRPLVFVGLASHARERSLTARDVLGVMDGLAAAGTRPVAVGLSYALPDDYEQFPVDSLAQTIALLELGDAFVGADSGLLHAAGTVGLPVVGVFGPTDPAMRLGYYDRAVGLASESLPCWPCWYARPCRDPRLGVPHLACLSGVSTSRIVEAVRGIL